MRNLILAAVLLTSVPAHAQSIPGLPRDVYIRGVIDERMALTVGDQIAGLNRLSPEVITIHITSPGGSVYSGLQIYDYMEESVAPIVTVCEGYCMSMAAFLLASGDLRESQASASIMFHQISTEAKGKIDDILLDLADAQRLQSMMDERLHDHTGLSIAAIRKMESYDHYFSPKEAKAANIIDAIRGKHGK